MVSDNYQHVIYWLVFYPGILIALLPSIIHRIPSTFPSCEVHAELTSDELKRQLFFFFAVIVGCDVVFLFDALFFFVGLVGLVEGLVGLVGLVGFFGGLWLWLWFVPVVVAVVCCGCGLWVVVVVFFTICVFMHWLKLKCFALSSKWPIARIFWQGLIAISKTFCILFSWTIYVDIPTSTLQKHLAIKHLRNHINLPWGQKIYTTAVCPTPRIPIQPGRLTWKPTNHPFGKENDLRKTSMIMFHDNLQGCTLCWLPLFFCSPPKPLPASFQFVHQPLRAGWTDEAFSRGGFFPCWDGLGGFLFWVGETSYEISNVVF